MPRAHRYLPLIVASPLFLQNVDSTAMVLALPSMAQAFGLPLLQLNLVITAYALSLAIFLPVSAWLADRYGARRVFCAAIIMFVSASALAALAGSLTQLVACRVLQGFGGALMVPVGRLILLRSVAPSELVSAMVWFTVPPLVGRLAGPLIGGALVSLASWQWILLVNLPLGLIALALALWLVEEVPPTAAASRFDWPGFLLLGLGLALLLGALQTARNALVAGWLGWTAAAFGAACLYGYLAHSRRHGAPLIDLAILRYRTLRINVLGAAPLRLGLAAVPFLLPLLMQLVFGYTPLMAGAIAAAAACGALSTRAVTRHALSRYSFRTLLLAASALTAGIWGSLALLSSDTALPLLTALIFASGFASSLCMVLLNTLGYSEVPDPLASHASALTTMAQQLMAAGGVVLAAFILSVCSAWRGGGEGMLALADFSSAFIVIGLLPLLSMCAFRSLHPEDGEVLR